MSVLEGLPAHGAARRIPRLGDLIAADGLNLKLVVGSEIALQRPVRGVHAIDLLNPGQWIDRDWVLLTTGSALVSATDDQQRDYIRELLETGVTALGVGVGIVFDEVPIAISATAEELGLAVFTVAPETPFRVVVSFVHEMEFGAVTRRLELHSRLIAAIGSSTPEAALVQRVASILDRPARLVDHTGHVIASEGSEAIYSVGAQHVVTPAPNSLHLTVPMRPTDGPDEAEVLDVARDVLRLLSAREEFQAKERRLARAELLDDILSASSASNAHALERRLISYGVDAGRGMAIICLESGVPSQDPLGAVETIAYSCGLSAILTHEGGTTTGLVEVGDGAAMSEFATRAGRDWLIGIGETFTRMQKASSSARIAEAALRIARERSGSQRGCVVTHAELGYSSWLLASMEPSVAAQRANRRLAVLQEQPLVFEAVQSYLECDLSVAKAAETLYIHANSLRYRLSRAELALGASLRNPEVISDLFLALRTPRRRPRS